MKKCGWCGKDIPFSKLKKSRMFFCSEECMRKAG